MTAAVALTAGAAAGFFEETADLAAPLAALSLPALCFAAGASVANRSAHVARRPVVGVVAVTALAPFAPILPGPAALVIAGTFLIIGLFSAGILGGILKAFARERTSSVVGGLFLAAAAALGIAGGFGAAPGMTLVVGLSGTIAALALGSVLASRSA